MEKNNRKIQFLHFGVSQRTFLAIVIVTLVIVGTLFLKFYDSQFPGSGKTLPYATDVTVAGLLQHTNAERQAHGVDSLSLHSSLNTAAQNKAQHMIDHNYWSHVAPDGTTPWQFIDTTGYLYNKAGENLAYGFLTSGGVVQGWMNSTGHRANMLDSSFNDVGFGFANGANFQGGENTVVVAMYADRYSPPPPAPPPSPPPPQSTSQPAPQAQPTPTVANATVEEDEPEPEEVGQEIEIPQEEVGFQIIFGSPNNTDIKLRQPLFISSGEVPKKTTNLEALLTGQAPLSLYMVASLMTMVGGIYFLRHVKAIHQFILKGEHLLVGHPLLEAAIIYLLIWLLLSATYGVVL